MPKIEVFTRISRDGLRARIQVSVYTIHEFVTYVFTQSSPAVGRVMMHVCDRALSLSFLGVRRFSAL